MKVILLFLIAFSLPAFAGGPDIDSQDLTVGKIITTGDEIIMQIDGTFKILTLRTPDEDHSDGGNAKMVPLVIRDGILRIPRKKWLHPGGEEYEVYLDWDQYRKDIMKWEGKKIMTQMWSTETIFSEGAPREIVAEFCKIWDRPHNEDSDHAETFLEIEEALRIASEAVADDTIFKDKFIISGKITEPSYPKEKYDGKVYVSVWRIDFSTYYPMPPSTPTYVEVTHDKKFFIRK